MAYERGRRRPQKDEATLLGSVAVNNAAQNWEKFGNTLGFVEDNPVSHLA
jgi:hypothetical protein